MWNNNPNNNLKYPKIQALQQLAHLSASMHMPGQHEGVALHQINPDHIQTNMLPVAGVATAEQHASQNPERFLATMKNANIKKNRGVAF